MATRHVSPLLRHILLCFYILLLPMIILVLVPVSILVKKLLHLLLKGCPKELADYYGQPSGG